MQRVMTRLRRFHLEFELETPCDTLGELPIEHPRIMRFPSRFVHCEINVRPGVSRDLQKTTDERLGTIDCCTTTCVRRFQHATSSSTTLYQSSPIGVLVEFHSMSTKALLDGLLQINAICTIASKLHTHPQKLVDASKVLDR